MAAHSSCIARAKLTFPILIVTEEKTTPWPKFDKAVSELHDWLSLVEDVIKNQRIMLGDVDEMQRLTNKQKQVSFFTVNFRSQSAVPKFFVNGPHNIAKFGILGVAHGKQTLKVVNYCSKKFL